MAPRPDCAHPFPLPPAPLGGGLIPAVHPAKSGDRGDYLFVVVQALDEYHPDAEIRSIEVDFYLGPNYVVSCRREPVSAIDQYRDRCLQDEYILSHPADWLMPGPP